MIYKWQLLIERCQSGIIKQVCIRCLSANFMWTRFSSSHSKDAVKFPNVRLFYSFTLLVCSIHWFVFSTIVVLISGIFLEFLQWWCLFCFERRPRSSMAYQVFVRYMNNLTTPHDETLVYTRFPKNDWVHINEESIFCPSKNSAIREREHIQNTSKMYLKLYNLLESKFLSQKKAHSMNSFWSKHIVS